MRTFELVLPAYNEASSLPALIQRVADAALEAHFTPATFQLVLVDNGSTDDSPSVLRGLGAGPLAPWFRVVQVQTNTGYGAGLKAGLSSTQAAFVGWSHADMQCDPGDAFTALRRCQAASKPTLVKGTRRGRALRDRFVSEVFAGVARTVLRLKVSEINAQPKVLPRGLLHNLAEAPNTFAFDLYMLYQAKRQGYAIDTVEVDFPPRIHGASKWASTFLGRHKTILHVIHYMGQLRHQQGPL